MLVLSINFFIVAIVFSDVTRAFRYNKVDAFKAVSNKLSPLSLFNWGKNANTVSTESAPVAKNTDAAKLNKLKSNLEKISYTQKRDYNAEALKKEPPKPVIRDLQPKSYNYRKPQEFPNLYSGWLQKDGDQIAKQMIAAAKSAITSDKYIEILFDPVPNLDEVAFGTEWNMKFRKELATNLKVPDYATNRGGPSTLEWSNIYWANRLAAGLGAVNKQILALSLSGTGTRGEFKPTLTKGLSLLTMTDAKKTGVISQLVTGSATSDVSSVSNKLSAVIVLSPCQESNYNDAKKIGDTYGVPVIALNSPYSYKYDIGAGGIWLLAYVMKRVPKGWIFRQNPEPFEAILEGPSYEISRVKTFSNRPTLVEISKVTMDESTKKYGSTGNDRIFQQRL